MTQDESEAEKLSYELRELGPDCRSDLAKVAALHMELLWFGPIAGLGEYFIREIGYGVHLRDGTLQVFLCEVGDEPAGFIAYTDRSVSFHRKSLASHFLRTVCALLASILKDPSVLKRLMPAVRMMLSRRGEQSRYQDPLGEVVAIAVRPEFLEAPIVERLGCRLSEELLVHAAVALHDQGHARMRGIVDADNKAPLFFYRMLGARLEPYQQGGKPQVQFWFDDLAAFLAERPAPLVAPIRSPTGP